jgi:hypothetical protein
MAATAALAGLSLASAYQESTALAAQGAQEKMNSQMESDVLKRNAEMKLQVGQEEYMAFKKKAKKLLGEQIVAQAASGVDVGYGSAAQVRTDTALELELDANRIINNATLEAFGLKNKANQVLLQGEAAERAYKNRANSTLMGGVLQAGAYAYQGMGKIKVPSSEAKPNRIADYGSGSFSYELNYKGKGE